MKHDDLTERMHAVLDGQASAGEARALQDRLAVDPVARAEFEELRQLFRLLDGVPAEHPPEGLVAAVTAAADARLRDQDQPFSSPRVFVHTASRTEASRPGQAAATQQSTRMSGTTSRSAFMTQQTNKSFGNRKVWFGAGAAALALLVVAQTAYEVPFSNDVLGTIMPAQRYRAAPNGSEDVKLAPAGGGSTAAQPVVAAPSAEAERAMAERAAADRLAAGKVVAEKVSAEKVAAEKMSAEKIAAEKLSAEKMSAEKMSAERMSAEKMSAGKTAAEKVAAEKMLAEKMAAEKFAADKLAAERLSAERAAMEKAAVDRAPK